MPKVIINSKEIVINQDLKQKYLLQETLDQISGQPRNDCQLVLRNDKGEKFVFYIFNNEIWYKGISYQFNKNTRQILNKVHDNELRSPMPGKVVKIFVKKNETVSKGQTLLVLEAMKMEHVIKSPLDGIVEDLLCIEGGLVDSEVELILIVKTPKSGEKT